MIKYKVTWRNKIEAVEIIRETKCFVIFISKFYGREEENRENKKDFYDTWEEAHSRLMEKAERILTAARNNLQCAQGEHGNIKGMKKPENN